MRAHCALFIFKEQLDKKVVVMFPVRANKLPLPLKPFCGAPQKS